MAPVPQYYGPALTITTALSTNAANPTDLTVDKEVTGRTGGVLLLWELIAEDTITGLGTITGPLEPAPATNWNFTIEVANLTENVVYELICYAYDEEQNPTSTENPPESPRYVRKPA